jgi:hypothetical protein
MSRDRYGHTYVTITGEFLDNKPEDYLFHYHFDEEEGHCYLRNYDYSQNRKIFIEIPEKSKNNVKKLIYSTSMLKSIESRMKKLFDKQEIEELAIKIMSGLEHMTKTEQNVILLSQK